MNDNDAPSGLAVADRLRAVRDKFGMSHDDAAAIDDAIAEADALRERLRAVEGDAREMHEAIPNLPITPETCDAATDAFTRFCIDFQWAIDAVQGRGESAT